MNDNGGESLLNFNNAGNLELSNFIPRNAPADNAVYFFTYQIARNK
jgi:hypothetical protein